MSCNSICIRFPREIAARSKLFKVTLVLLGSKILSNAALLVRILFAACTFVICCSFKDFWNSQAKIVSRRLLRLQQELLHLQENHQNYFQCFFYPYFKILFLLRAKVKSFSGVFWLVFIKACSNIIMSFSMQNRTLAIVLWLIFDLTSYKPPPNGLQTGIPIGQPYSTSLISAPMIFLLMFLIFKRRGGCQIMSKELILLVGLKERGISREIPLGLFTGLGDNLCVNCFF